MTRITRVEVITNNGREYVSWEDDNDISYMLQDSNRTLKVFVGKTPPEQPITEEENERYFEEAKQIVENHFAKKKMTEIEKTKKEIEVLTKKLSFLEELEKTKTPCEEAYKRCYGEYPVTDITDTCWSGNKWMSFVQGYGAAQEDYKVGEFQHLNEEVQEPEENEWKLAALRFGEKLSSIGPCGYYDFTPGEWVEWALNAYEKTSDEYLKLLEKQRVKAQKRGERVHKEVEKLQDKNWYVDTKTNLKPHWEPKPHIPEKTEKSLREAFVKAQQTEKWKETQKKIDEEDNDKNFKSSLDLIKEWGEKNKPPTLKELLCEWWDEDWGDTKDKCIDMLVDMIDKKFIPPSNDTNGYEWEKCLKMMRDKLR